MPDVLNMESVGGRADLALRYDRRAVTSGIVHLGVGNFHRAHQAVYIDDVLASDPAWGITGVSLRSAAVRDALAPQDWLYSVFEKRSDETKLRIVGALKRVLHAPSEGKAVLDTMAALETKLVTLTISEKGYGLASDQRDLDVTRDDIAHDLANPAAPKTAVGYTCAALDARRLAGVQPFTCISCDNLPSNGQKLRRLVLAFAERTNLDLARWIERECAFPSTMVDRIVPATTDSDCEQAFELLDLRDAWPVMTEPFKQWVIEDWFCNDRPKLENVGAEMVSDVEPYELMKLRMLNGAHSLLAYLGQLRGCETVADAMADHEISRRVRDLWTYEIPDTVPLPNEQLSSYAKALDERFANTALKHRTKQIAVDGSQKVPQRFLAPLMERAANDLPVPQLAGGVAAWLAYIWSSMGSVDDPFGTQFETMVRGCGTRDAFFEAMLNDTSIFAGLADDQQFKQWVLSAVKSLPV